jgi:iron complex outermembrane recepter protein
MITPRFTPSPLALAVCCAFGAFALTAQAADDENKTPDAAAAAAPAPAATPAATGDAVKLDAISVVSERPKGFRAKTVQVGTFRDQEMLDVPLTVSVIPRAVLDAQDAHGLYDALKNTAGVTRSQLNGTVYDNLAIRGINVDNRTSYRLNGSLPINNLIDLPLENKERVEALKGASSLYYGFTSPVGIVNLVTKRAGSTPNTSIALSGNEYGQVLAHVDAGRKFGDEEQFGARVNVVGGKLRNAIDGAEGDRAFGSAALDWAATDKLSFKFDIEQFNKNITEPAVIVMPAAVNGVITLPRLPDASKLLSGTWAKTKADAQNVLLRSDYRINDDWSVLAEAGRARTTRNARNYSQLQNYNSATGQGTLAFSLQRDLNYVNRNLRVEVDGRFPTGPVMHELSFGAMQNKRYASTPNSQSVSVSQNLYNPVSIAEIPYTITTVYSPVNITDKGVYAFDRLHLSENWQLLAGARAEDYENSTYKASTGVTTKYTANKTTGSFGGLYKIRKDTSIYATYIEGLEETGIAGVGLKNAGEALPPAVSKQKELGVRTEAWSGMSGSIAYFELERATTYQKKVLSTDTLNSLVLDGRTLLKGIEFALNGEITPQVSIYGSGMLLNATLKNAADTNIIGKTPDATPERTYSLLAEYRPDLLPGFSVNGGAYYVGPRPLNNLNQGWLPGYTIFSTGVRYITKMAGKTTTFQVNVENAGDKAYWSAASGGYLSVGLPRTVSATMKVDL